MAVLDETQEKVEDYSSIKRSINKLKRDISGVEEKIEANKNDRAKAIQDIDDLDIKEQTSIEEDKRKQMQEHIDRQTASTREKISNVELKKVEAKNRYDAKMLHFEDESCVDEYMEDISSFNELDDVIDAIHSSIEESLGSAFKDKLLLELNNIVPNKKLSAKRISSLKVKLEEALEEIQDTPSNRNFEVLNDLTVFLEGLDSDENNTIKGEWFVLLIFVLSIGAVFLTKFIAPVYIVILFVLFCLNYSRHSKLFKNAILFSSISANIENLKNSAKEEALVKLEEDKEQYIASYNEAVDKFDNKLANLQENLTRETAEARYTFKYDSSSVNSMLNQMKIQYKTRVSELDKEISDYENLLDSYKSQLAELENKLTQSSEHTKNMYLDFNRIGDSFLLDSSFLIDIKPSGQPVIWDFPETNILMISDDEDDYYNFTGLIVSQLRSRLSPFALKVVIIDSKGAGIEYQHLVDNASTVGRIVTSEQEFREEMLTIIETQEARISTVLREFATIAEYNAYMLSIDSIAESYMFYFVPFPSESLISNESMLRILNVCYKVGIYFIFYTNKKNLSLYKDITDFIDTVQNFYIIENGQLGKWAKSFVVDLLSKDKNGGV